MGRYNVVAMFVNREMFDKTCSNLHKIIKLLTLLISWFKVLWETRISVSSAYKTKCEWLPTVIKSFI